MKLFVIACLVLCGLPAGTMADKPRVNRATIYAMEKGLDRKLSAVWSGDPVPSEVVGLTQGAYITGYGAVFMSEVNVAVSAGISPFHPSATPDDIKRVHEKKLARLAEMKTAMQDMLLDSAKSLDTVPADEQIALGISLFYWTWEDRTGLPAQIVMHAPRRVLLQGKATLDKTSITTEEF
jgi:hypothetical protein